MTLPDCMMPDGAEPCIAYRDLSAEVSRLRAWLERINADTYGDSHLNDSADALEGKPCPGGQDR